MTEFERGQSERLGHLRMACQALKLSGKDITSPAFNDSSLVKKFDRVFVIHKYKLIYFFIPKVSSTSWKRLLLVLHGYDIFRNPTQEKYRRSHFRRPRFREIIEYSSGQSEDNNERIPKLCLRSRPVFKIALGVPK